MKSRETLIRLKKFQVDEKRRKVAQIETMIAEFDRIAGDLDREIKTEQERAGIHDPAHFAYPTYAKAAIGRRENLKRSADELKAQLDDAKASLGEAFEELKEGRDARRARPRPREGRAERPRADRTRPHRHLALLFRQRNGLAFPDPDLCVGSGPAVGPVARRPHFGAYRVFNVGSSDAGG